jgi:para-nitrobenzyl esterase
MRIGLTVLGLVFLITACDKNDESIITPPNNEEKVIVKVDSTYNINLVENITYAEALKHDDWNSTTTIVIPLKLDAYIVTTETCFRFNSRRRFGLWLAYRS